MRSVILVFIAWLGVAASAAAHVAPRMTVGGTEFVVTLGDGRVMRRRDLAGTVLDVRFAGRPMRLRIASVEPDPQDRTGTVWLHTFETPDADGGWRNFCTAGPDGRRQGFPLAGGPDGVELSCTAGAIAKCVRFGYRRWTDAADGAALAPLHAACVRMVRGDYGGAGRPWTKDGMQIDVYDDHGVQRPDNGPDDAFEAGWGPGGAVCVHHVRVSENVALAELEILYPKLRGRTGAICTEEFARAHGALIFNRSRP
jgi:hypothetical protein